MKLIEIRSLLDKAKARHNELVVKESLTEEERSELESKTAEVRDLQVKEVALAALEAPEPVHDTPEKEKSRNLLARLIQATILRMLLELETLIPWKRNLTALMV